MEYSDFVKYVNKLSDLTPQEVEWLWYPYIPKGKITILQGDPGEGKTTLALNLAALLSRGYVYGDTTKRRAMDIMIQSAEDGLRDTILPRLLQAGADLHHIVNIKENTEPLTVTDDLFRASVQYYCPDLLIIDPLQAYLGADVDMHRANEVRPVLSSLAELAERCGTAVLLIGHMNKMAGLKALYKGLGSIDIAAAARSVLLAAKNPNDPGVLLMGQIKSSLAPAGAVIGFERTERGNLRFIGEQNVDMQRLLDGTSHLRPRDLASDFLQDFLDQGRKPVSEVMEEARKRNLHEATVIRAAKALGILRIREGNHFFMQLPSEEPESEPAAESELLPESPADFVEL